MTVVFLLLLFQTRPGYRHTFGSRCTVLLRRTCWDPAPLLCDIISNESRTPETAAKGSSLFPDNCDTFLYCLSLSLDRPKTRESSHPGPAKDILSNMRLCVYKRELALCIKGGQKVYSKAKILLSGNGEQAFLVFSRLNYFRATFLGGHPVRIFSCRPLKKRTTTDDDISRFGLTPPMGKMGGILATTSW